MFLNGTILAQAVNFLIAYFLLSRFFLKYAIEIVKKEKGYLHSLYSKLKFNQEKIIEFGENNNKAWKECKESASALKPDIEPPAKISRNIEQDFIELETTEKEKKDLASKLKQTILKRID